MTLSRRPECSCRAEPQSIWPHSVSRLSWRGSDPGGPSRLRHHGLWLFYSRDGVRRERNLRHNLCSHRCLPKSLKTWIYHVFYHQKNLGRTLVFCNVLKWTFGLNCLSYKDDSKHYLVTVEKITSMSFKIQKINEFIITLLKKKAETNENSLITPGPKILTLKFKGKY